MYASMRENTALDAARAIVRGATARQAGDVSTAMLEQQVCAEAGLWETAAARRALDQAYGDTPHAVSMLRVWAATQPHLRAFTVDPGDVAIVRRLSSAYPEIPGGQWLGFSSDLVPRQLNWAQAPSVDEAGLTPGATAPAATGGDAPTRGGVRRVRDLIDGVSMVPQPDDGQGEDPAHTVLMPPFTRASRLGLLARGETGALVALSALILGRRQEAVLVELTIAVARIRIPHPRTDAPCAVVDVPITEVEVVLDADVDGKPGLAMGWGASMGTVERRGISLALLDAAMQADGELREQLVLDEQTVIAATDGSATNGFVEHLRLPHYAGFAAYLAQAAVKQAR